MVSEVLPLDEINRAFDLLHEGKVIRSVIRFLIGARCATHGQTAELQGTQCSNSGCCRRRVVCSSLIHENAGERRLPKTVGSLMSRTGGNAQGPHAGAGSVRGDAIMQNSIKHPEPRRPDSQCHRGTRGRVCRSMRSYGARGGRCLTTYALDPHQSKRPNTVEHADLLARRQTHRCRAADRAHRDGRPQQAHACIPSTASC